MDVTLTGAAALAASPDAIAASGPYGYVHEADRPGARAFGLKTGMWFICGPWHPREPDVFKKITWDNAHRLLKI